MEKLIKKGEDLYAILGLPKRNTEENKAITLRDITKAYRQEALQCHPDRAEGKKDIRRFQRVSAAYSVLREEASRSAYDATGVFGAECCPLTSRQQDWTNLFRAMYDEVTEEEVKAFYEGYSGSQDEIDDLVHNFDRVGGNFEVLIENYALFDNSKAGQVNRIKGIIDVLVQQKKVKKSPLYKKTSTKKILEKLESHYEQERRLAVSEMTTMNQNTTKAIVQPAGNKPPATSLQVSLLENGKRMDDFVSALIEKYETCANESKKRKKVHR